MYSNYCMEGEMRIGKSTAQAVVCRSPAQTGLGLPNLSATPRSTYNPNQQRPRGAQNGQPMNAEENTNSNDTNGMPCISKRKLSKMLTYIKKTTFLRISSAYCRYVSRAKELSATAQ